MSSESEDKSNEKWTRKKWVDKIRSIQRGKCV